MTDPLSARQQRNMCGVPGAGREEHAAFLSDPGSRPQREELLSDRPACLQLASRWTMHKSLAARSKKAYGQSSPLSRLRPETPLLRLR
ncbi:MAG TPA: hypothetical protein VGF67_24450 [Ktedonobacteraceae bacterium]